ncbi:MAG: hypothetical protein WBA67_07850 [Jannaschia sp.]
MVAVLACQALVFAGWVVVSFGILWGVLRRATVAGAFPGPSAQLAALGAYLRDPETRARRRTWLALTAGLIVLSAVTAIVISAA